MSRTPIFIGSSDNHLAPHIWIRRPDIAGDSYFGFEQLVDACLELGTDLLLPGDVFDKTRPDPATIAFARQQLCRLAAAGLDIFYIQGQHEFDAVTPWLSAISDHVEYIDRKLVGARGINLYGLDWRYRGEINQELAKVPHSCDILLAHQMWTDFVGRFSEGECRFSEVPHARMMTTGDYHRTIAIESACADGSIMQVLSSGSTHIRSIDEPADKYCFVIYDDLSWDARPLKSRAVGRYRASDSKRLDELCENWDKKRSALFSASAALPPNLMKPIICIEYDSEIPEAAARIANLVGTDAHLFAVPIRRSLRELPVASARHQASGQTIESCLSSVVPHDSPAHSNLLTLLGSRDPAARISDLHDSYVNEKLRGFNGFQSNLHCAECEAE